MKKLILLLLVLGALQINAQKDTLYIKNSSSKFLISYLDSLKKYTTFVQKKAQLKRDYAYMYEVKKGGALKQYKFGNVEEVSCVCGLNNDEEFIFLNNDAHYKPVQPVALVERPLTMIKRDTITKYRSVIKRDTVNFIVRDTIQLPCQESVSLGDSSILIRHTSIDKQTKLDYSTNPVTPYLEKRLYDYNGKYMGTVRVDPLTYEPFE